MPGDVMPLTGLAASVSPPGSVAPICAHSTLRPGAGTLGAPHTTCVAAPPRSVTTSTSVSLSACGCGFLPTTSATTTPENPAPRLVMPSISRPPRVSARASFGGRLGAEITQLEEPAPQDLHQNCSRAGVAE